MTAIRRITASVIATVGTVLGLLAAAAAAAASPAPPNDGNAFPSVPQPPTNRADHDDREQRLALVDIRPRRRGGGRGHAAREPGCQPAPSPRHCRPTRPLSRWRTQDVCDLGLNAAWGR